MIYRFTHYFEQEVLRKRPYLRKEWCITVLKDPLKIELQEDNRYRFWGFVQEKYLRVVTRQQYMGFKP